MLVSVVVQFRPTEDAAIPPTNGHLVHAWFLDLVQKQDAALAERLHADSREKPFTVSPINGKIERHEGRWWLMRGQAYWVRFTGLAKEVSEVLAALPLKSGNVAGLGRVPCEIVGVCREASEHEWAGTSAYESLAAEGPEQRGLAVSLRFVSPTTFRQEDRNEPFPLHALVFGSLARKWDAWAPVPLGPELTARTVEAVMESRYVLTTRMQDFGRYRLVGFTGTCEYQVRREADPAVRQAVRTLAAFAFYAGVGYHTTMGLGQARAM